MADDDINPVRADCPHSVPVARGIRVRRAMEQVRPECTVSRKIARDAARPQ